jgi:hypothetical protein
MKPILKTTSKMNTRIQALMAIGAISCGVSAVQAASQTPAAASTTPAAAAGAPSHDDLAKKLANPVAAMISVPFQNNFDWGGGPNGDGFQWKLNVQPVIPFSLNKDWNLITRTIIPVISQNDIVGTTSQTGLSDIELSAWFSPKAPTSSGWIWGAGPAFLFPTGTDDVLTANQWAVGPTVVLLKQQGKFTYGGLANQLWSYSGNGGRSTLNQTFIEPFLSYIPGGGWTYTIQTETSYDWTAKEFTIPINLEINKMITIGKTHTQWQLGARYYAAKPDNGPNWGLRFACTIIIPKS